MKRALTATLALMLLAPLAMAHPEEDCEQEDRKRKPPIEAVEACEGLQLDDLCDFVGREGKDVTGACFVPSDAPADAPLACRPAKPPPRQ